MIGQHAISFLIGDNFRVGGGRGAGANNEIHNNYASYGPFSKKTTSTFMLGITSTEHKRTSYPGVKP